jgi:hypothetical protein
MFCRHILLTPFHRAVYGVVNDYVERVVGLRVAVNVITQPVRYTDLDLRPLTLCEFLPALALFRVRAFYRGGAYGVFRQKAEDVKRDFELLATRQRHCVLLKHFVIHEQMAIAFFKPNP